MIDSHCHLDLAVFDPDRAEVLDRAEVAGVKAVLVPAIRPSTWPRLLELQRELESRRQDAVRPEAAPDANLDGNLGANPGETRAAPDQRGACRIFVALGVHPQVVPSLTPEERALACDPEALANAIGGRGAHAVGECGLDGATGELDLQAEVLRAHVRAARQLGLPLSLHVLRAHDLALRVLKEERVGEAGGVLHSYSGGAALVPVYRDLGLCFSLAGPVTYLRARRPVEAARAIPEELLLAETDAPDQTPVPHQGQRCEPAFVADVVAGLALARGTTPAQMASLTDRNARRLFRLPPHRP